jgi:putative MATE family efflux protein
VLNLSLPAFGSLVAPPLFLLVDAAIVASLGTTALAGLGAGSTVFSAIVGLSFFLAYQTTGSVSRALGAGDHKRALASAGNNLALGIALGCALGLGLYIYADQLLDLIGVSTAVAPAAKSWLHAITWAMPGALGTMAAIGLFRGFSNTKITLYITTIQVAINAALCWLFVMQFEWGIAGSAWATSFAETIGLILYLAVIHQQIDGGLRSLVPRNFLSVWQSLGEGTPLIWRSVMLRGVLSGVVVAAAHLGDVQLAAFHVSFVVWYTLALSLDAIAIAAQAIIGGLVGSGKTETAHHVLWQLVRWGVWLGVAQGALVMVTSPFIAQAFSEDPQLTNLITIALIAVGIHQPLAAVVFVLDGVLIGAGDTKFLAKVHTIGFLIFLPLIIGAVLLQLHLVFLWVVMIIFIGIRCALLIRRARTDDWMLNK